MSLNRWPHLAHLNHLGTFGDRVATVMAIDAVGHAGLEITDPDCSRLPIP